MSPSLPSLFLLLGGSFAAGVLGALMGLGGGVLIIPLLTALGVDIRFAIPVSIVAVIATSSGAAASYVRDGLANLRAGILLAVATTSGALAGAYANGLVPSRLLFIIFAGVLACSGVLMLRKGGMDERGSQVSGRPDRFRLASSFHDREQGREVHYVPTRVGLAFALMGGAGAVSGLLGIGSGALKVPAMDLAMKLPIKVSTATSNFMIGITGLASALVYLRQGRVLVWLATPIALGVVCGSMVGTKLLVRLRSTTIRRAFVGVLAVVVVQMSLKGLGI